MPSSCGSLAPAVAPLGVWHACRRRARSRSGRRRVPPARWPRSAALAYSAGVEVRSFRCAGSRCRCCPPGAPPAAVLHVSDLHLTPSQGASRRGCARWPTSSPTWWSTPATTSPTATRCRSCSTRLGPLLDVPGVFVLGSNDYFAPIFKNPLRYLLPDDGQRNTGTPRAALARPREAASSGAAGST